jgi:hypothetical protein
MRGLSFAAMIVAAASGTTSCSLVTSFDGFGSGTGASSGSGGASSGGGGSVYRAAVLADNPLAYWRFGEATGTQAADETGKGNTAFIGGGVTWGAAGALMNDANTAVSLAGVQCLEVANSSFDFPGTHAFSLEGWVKLSAPPDNAYRHLYIKDDSMNAMGRQEYGVYLEDADGIAFERYVNNGSRNLGAPAPTVGVWTYFVATYDGTQLTFYVDAMDVGSVPDARSQLSITNPEFLGCKSFTYPGVQGDLDEFAIYDHALPLTRITAHYAASGRP